MMKRILFIAHRVPYPPNKGERVRAFEEIKSLSRSFRVTLATLAHNEADENAAHYLQPWCEKLLVARAGGARALLRGGWSLLAGQSLTEGMFRSQELLKLIRQESLRNPFDVAIAYSSSMLPYLPSVPAAWVADLVDVDSAKWGSYASRAGLLKRWLYRREQQGVSALENWAVEKCQAVVLVSQAESEMLEVAPGRVLAVGNGVDLDYFSPMPTPSGDPSLVFTGTMSYQPNVDAVCWFARHVLPMLRRELPKVTFTIVGRDPAGAVRRLAGAPGVRVTGAVEDVRPYLQAATLAVAPLRMARGIQNKVLEAMAMGRAVVASRAALEGLEAAKGREVLQAELPNQWRSQIVNLVKDTALRERVASAARLCVQDKYSWDSRLAPLVSLCERLCEAGNASALESGGLHQGQSVQ